MSIYKFTSVIFLMMVYFCSCAPKKSSKEVELGSIRVSSNADSIGILSDSLEKADVNGPDSLVARANFVKGAYYNRKGYARQAQKVLKEGLALQKDKTQTLLWARTILSLGISAKILGEYPQALDLFKQSLIYYEKVKDVRGIAGVQGYIGEVFQLQGDLESATHHLNTGLALMVNQQQTTEYLMLLHTLANAYGMQNKIDSALALDEQGLQIAKKMKQTWQMSPFLDNKANCFMYSNRPDSARHYFKMCLALDAGLKKQLSDTWLNLGVLERMQQNHTLAVANLKKSIVLATAANYRQGAMAAWETLTSIYQETRQFENALKAQSKFIALKDTITNEKKDNAIAEWKAIYETDKKEQEIRLQEAQLDEKNLVILAVILGAVLILLIALFLHRRSKNNKERAYQNSLLAQEQKAVMEIIAAEENERKRIAADLHDGIGQTMTAAWLNLQALIPMTELLRAEDAHLVNTTSELVGNSCAEIRQISHNMMPNILFRQGLIPALQTFIRQTGDNALSIILTSEEKELHLDKTTELVLYRVVQECVNNVIKHARATELYISVSKEDEYISVLIEDNGVGFDVVAAEQSLGIGLQNIRSRIHYLHGTVEWNSSIATDSGTVVAIYIPYAS